MQEPQTNPHHEKRWLILFVIAIAQLMVVLDATVVNIALPSAQEALAFSNDQRQWVITAYALAFGSLLLLGGRIGDLFGRKRAFVIGLGGFAGASALGGFAQSFEVLVAARALQGVFGALLAPAALSLLTTTFTDPRGARQGVRHLRRRRRRRRGDRPDPRRRADRVPQLALVPVRQPRLRRAGHARRRCRCCTTRSPTQRARIDVPGTLTATTGLFAIVYGLANAETHSWTDPVTIGMLVACVVLLSCFVAIQRRSPNPLLPLRVVLDRDRGGSLLAMLLSGAGMFAVFLFLTYYLQQTLQLLADRVGARVPADDARDRHQRDERVDEAAAEDRPAAAHRRRHDDRRVRPADADEHRRRHVVRRRTCCRGS